MARCRHPSPPLPAALLALACTLGPAALLAGPTDAPSRFRVAGVLEERATSADGRFAVLAELRHAPEADSADRRFTLKAVNVPDVGCDPLGPDLFGDGFENP